MQRREEILDEAVFLGDAALLDDIADDGDGIDIIPCVDVPDDGALRGDDGLLVGLLRVLVDADREMRVAEHDDALVAA